MSSKDARLLLLAGCAVALASCGGGGGGGTTPPPQNTPTVTLSASPTSIPSGGMVTLTWSSTNATTCTATGGWTGSRATSGTEQAGPLTAAASYSLSCSSGTLSGSASANVAVTAPISATVSGTLTVPTTSQTDTDTNDDGNTPVGNNSFATAQSLPNPVITGGFANLPNTGDPDGRLFTSGDTNDYFRVNLLAGQVIELRVANDAPQSNDLDLRLYNSGQALVGSSLGLGKTERLTIAASGLYFVRVNAFAGASNYILTIGQTGTTATASDLELSRDFVPGEVLVKTLSVSAQSADQNSTRIQARLANAFGLQTAYTTPGLYSLMTLSSQTTQALATSHPQVQALDEDTQFASEAARAKYETLMAVKLLRLEPGVEWAEPNWIMQATAIPNDPSYPQQRWHYEQINLPAAWDITTGSANVIAAVIDSGVRPHADLTPRLVAGYDFVRGAGAGDGNDDDTDAADPGTPSQGSFVFHGTHVAGTIGAAGNNNQGVTGVAWNTRIMPIRALGVTGSGSTADIIEGILFAARLANRSGTLPAVRADVINMSLGGAGLCAGVWQQAITAARNAGVIVVAAAGNNGLNGDYTPAGCTGVVTVSSVGVDRKRAPYSNFGKGVDIAAPGGDQSVDRNGDGSADGIYSTYSLKNDDGTYSSTYAQLQGTSMATPHVVGVISLMKAVNPSLTPANFDNLLTSGALTDDIGPAGPDDLGVGLINALKAVRAASSAPPAPPPQLSVSPTTVNFGDIGTANEVTVSNSGTGTINVTATSTTETWLTVAPVTVGANGLGTYRISVNRTGLADGTYNGSVEFTGSAGTVARVSVLMQVSTTPVVADAGHHYVLLIDPVSGDTVDQVDVTARGGPVNFTFTAISAGTYELTAGTDLNNDGFICDEGEACAEYPIFGEAEPIVVNGNLSGLNMLTGFRSNADTQAASMPDQPPPPAKSGYRRLR